MEQEASKHSRGVTPPPSCLPMLLTIFVLLLVFAIFVSPCAIPRGARELAKQAMCGSNMKNLGTALHMYATANDDVYPPNLKTLIIAGQVADLFVCPSAGTEPLQELMDYEGHYNFDLEGHCDYIYIAGMDDNSSGSLIILFELPVNHGQEAANIGFLDSHVERYHDFSVMLEGIQKSNDHLAERRSFKP